MAQTVASELVRMHEGREVPHPGACELDRSHSAVEFVAWHLMISKGPQRRRALTSGL
jgi:hypothetical protein